MDTFGYIDYLLIAASLVVFLAVRTRDSLIVLSVFVITLATLDLWPKDWGVTKGWSDLSGAFCLVTMAVWWVAGAVYMSSTFTTILMSLIGLFTACVAMIDASAPLSSLFVVKLVNLYPYAMIAAQSLVLAVTWRHGITTSDSYDDNVYRAGGDSVRPPVWGSGVANKGSQEC